MSRAYVDGSCIVSLALNDVSSAAVRDWLIARDPDLSVSDFGWGEVVSAIGARSRGRFVTTAGFASAVALVKERIADWGWLKIMPENIADATAFVTDFSLALRLPDVIHIAVARRTDATLLTTDHGQASAAAAFGVSVADPTNSNPEIR